MLIHGVYDAQIITGFSLGTRMNLKIYVYYYMKFSFLSNWVSSLIGLLRCGKSCRLRWTNYLRPDIKRGPFTLEEEKLVIQLHGILGNRYFAILLSFV